MPQLQFRHDDQTAVVEIAPDGTISVADTRFQVEAVGAGVYRVSADGRSWTVAVAGPPDDRWVAIGGVVARVETVSAAAGRRGAKRSRGGDPLATPMPATVVKVLVDEGATVASGDTLLVLEAMKMELSIRAPRDGVVRRIDCRPGQLVQPGVPLVDLQ